MPRIHYWFGQGTLKVESEGDRTTYISVPPIRSYAYPGSLGDGDTLGMTDLEKSQKPSDAPTLAPLNRASN